MTFQVIHSKDVSNAQSPFRVIEQPIGREVEWINRFLDRERVRCLAETTLRSYSMDLLHFLRWWASVNHTDVLTEAALTTSVLTDYLRFQAVQQPRPPPPPSTGAWALSSALYAMSFPMQPAHRRSDFPISTGGVRRWAAAVCVLR